MRVSIIVTDDDGNTYQGEANLNVSASAKPARKRVKPDSGVKTNASTSVKFLSPIRAFVKKHGRGMSGRQKFTLLVAYLSKGDTHKQVLVVDVQKQWNKMKPLLGGKFNLAYPNRAKENEWVDSPKRGIYVLLPGWKGIFNA